MGKNIKSYATFPQSISPGKGREALQQKVQIFRLKTWYGLTVHIRFKNCKQNFQTCALSFSNISSESSKIRSIRPKKSCEQCCICTIYSSNILVFRCPTIGRELSQISANQADFTHFATDTVNCVKLAPIINPFILCFRGLPRQRTLRNSSELCKFHTIHPQLPRIT